MTGNRRRPGRAATAPRKRRHRRYGHQRRRARVPGRSRARACPAAAATGRFRGRAAPSAGRSALRRSRATFAAPRPAPARAAERWNRRNPAKPPERPGGPASDPSPRGWQSRPETAKPACSSTPGSAWSSTGKTGESITKPSSPARTAVQVVCQKSETNTSTSEVTALTRISLPAGLRSRPPPLRPRPRGRWPPTISRCRSASRPRGGWRPRHRASSGPVRAAAWCG